MSVTTRGRKKLIHHKEIKGVQKHGLSIMAHERTNKNPPMTDKEGKKEMFQEESSLITSLTAEVRSEEMTMNNSSTLFCLIFQMLTCNMG